MWSWWSWLTSTTSMGGKSSKRRPGGRRRRPPTRGAERSDHVGSVRTFQPSIWRRTVEWFTNVTRSRPSSTQEGGGGPGGVFVKERQGPRDTLSRRSQSAKPVVSGSG